MNKPREWVIGPSSNGTNWTIWNAPFPVSVDDFYTLIPLADYKTALKERDAARAECEKLRVATPTMNALAMAIKERDEARADLERMKRWNDENAEHAQRFLTRSAILEKELSAMKRKYESAK